MAELHTADLIDDAALADDVEFGVRLADAPGLLKATFAKFKAYLLSTVKIVQFSDVDVTTPPTDGQALVYSEADLVWKPGSVAAGTGGGGTGGGSLQPIQQQVVDAETATVTFAGLSGLDFEDLVLVASGIRSDNAATIDTLKLTINGDETANYHYQRFNAVGSGASEGDPSSANTYANCNSVTGGTAPAIAASSVDLTIPGYKRTDFGKTMRSFNTYWDAALGSDQGEAFTSNYWGSTDAIDSLSFTLLSGGNFQPGSVFTLYGRTPGAGTGGGTGGGTGTGSNKPWYFSPPKAADFGTTLDSFRGGTVANALVVADDDDVGMSYTETSTDATFVKTMGRPIPAANQGPGTTFTFTAHMKGNSYTANDQFGIWVRASATQYIFFGLFMRGTTYNLQRAYYNAAWNDGSFGLGWNDNDVWLRIVVSDETTSYFVSADGKNFDQVYGPDENLFTAPFTEYGFYMGSYGSDNPHIATVDCIVSDEFPLAAPSGGTGGGAAASSDLIAYAYANDTAALPSNVSAEGGLITDMSVTFTLDADAVVQLQFSNLLSRVSGSIRNMIYIDGVEIDRPDPVARFQAVYQGSDNLFNSNATLVFPLTAGEHTIELHYSDVATVQPVTFYQRMMTVRKIA